MGSDRETIFGRDRYILHMGWSPEGTQIAYVVIVQYANQPSGGRAHFVIVVANADGSGARQLAEGVNEG